MRLSLILPVLAIVGCTQSVNPFAEVDVLRAPLGDFRLVVAWPEGIATEDTQARVHLRAFRTDTGATREGVAFMRPIEGDGHTVYALSPTDLARLEQVQRDIAAWDTTTPDETNGAFSVTVAPCGAFDGFDPGDRISAWVGVGSDQPLVRIADSVPVDNWIDLDSPAEACG